MVFSLVCVAFALMVCGVAIVGGGAPFGGVAPFDGKTRYYYL